MYIVLNFFNFFKEVLENVIASIAKLINCLDTQAAIKVVPVANVILGNVYNFKFIEIIYLTIFLALFSI